MDKNRMLDAMVNHYAQGNKAAFSRMIGITPQTLTGWYVRDYMDYELLFAKLTNINATWLLSGEGSMFSIDDEHRAAALQYSINILRNHMEKLAHSDKSEQI